MKLRCPKCPERMMEPSEALICHHCGMPICKKHVWFAPADNAFARGDEPAAPGAMHCEEHARSYHRSARQGLADQNRSRTPRETLPSVVPPP